MRSLQLPSTVAQLSTSLAEVEVKNLLQEGQSHTSRQISGVLACSRVWCAKVSGRGRPRIDGDE